MIFFSTPEPTLADRDANVTEPEAPAIRDVTTPNVPAVPPADDAVPAGDDALGDLIRQE